MSLRRPLSYKIEAGFGGNSPKAVLRCAGLSGKPCPAASTLSIAITGTHNPEMTIKRARSAGWRADLHNPSMTLCPECIEARAERRKGESPMLIAFNDAKAAKAAAANDPKGSPMPAPQTPPKAVPDPPAVPARRLTPDERARVRTLLDANFLDDRGMYLAGWSDEKIAQDVNVPRALVTELREAAYGPVLIDAEADSIMQRIVAEHAAAKAAVEALQASASAIRELADAEVAKAQTLANEARGRLGRIESDILVLRRKFGGPSVS